MIKNIILNLTLASILVAANDTSFKIPCKARVIKKGCYQDPGGNQRTLLNNIFNYYEKIDWDDGWDDYLEYLKCRCANEALGQGYRFFGLQYFKECWAGELESDFFDRKPKANQKCWGVKPDYDKCNDTVGTACVGMDHFNYIYEIVFNEEKENNICEQESPCQHGECIPDSDSYSCICDSDYEGFNCETLIDDCASNPCVKGECIDGVNSYTCTCETGYEGENCAEVVMEPLSCSNANWWLSFDKEGWSSCAKKNRYIKGFQRSPPKEKSDPIYMLEEAKCCTAIPLWDKLDAECFEANWWLALDKKNQWALCPPGYFLNGLYRTKKNHLHNIEEGRCCKPTPHPNWYGQCYDENVATSFNNQGLSECSRRGYYIAGIHRDSGKDWLQNIDKFRCCQMFPSVSCETANWWLSFDKEGWSKCANDNLFITGFYRSAKSGSDGIYHLEKARCCGSSARYQGESRKCVEANWWTILDSKKKWAKCPDGYFLNGLKRTSGNNVHNIEEGKCCRPKSHPNKYEDCYDEDIKKAFSDKGWGSCARANYYVTGIYRHNGDKLHDIQKLRCCKMIP